MQDLSGKVNNGGVNAQGKLDANEFIQMAIEFNNLIAEGGQTPTSANLSQATAAIVAIAKAASAEESAYYVDSGAANAYSLASTDTTPITSYVAGTRYRFIATSANTGASTLKVDTGAVLPLKKERSAPADLAAGDVVSGGSYIAEYINAVDGFLLVSDNSISSNILPNGFIHGFETENNPGSPLDTINISSGSARTSDNLYNAELGVTIQKDLSSAWALGSGSGGLFTGSLVANESYHAMVIVSQSDQSIVDVGFDTDVNGANVPSGYSFRRVASIMTDSSGNIRQYFQRGNRYKYATPELDVSSTLGNSELTFNLPVPSGVEFTVESMVSINGNDESAFIYHPEESHPGARSVTTPQLITIGQSSTASNSAAVSMVYTPCNTSGQLSFIGSGSGSLAVSVHGYIDTERG